MELVQLRLVRQILEAGSLSKASMRLNRAQSVISRQLAALEKECGGRIFYRNGRGVELTELGERILPEVDTILAAARNISGALEPDDGGAGGTVRIGVIPSASLNVISPLHLSLRESHPNIQLHVHEDYSGDLDEQLANKEIDVAVLLRTGIAIAKDDHVIDEWETYVVGLPDAPAVQGDTISFQQLDGIPLLLPSAPNAGRESIDERAIAANVRLNIVVEVGGPHSTRDLLFGGAGYLIAPFAKGTAARMSWVGDAVTSGRLKASRLVDPPLIRTLVVSSASVPRLSTQIVTRQLVKTLQQLANG